MKNLLIFFIFAACCFTPVFSQADSNPANWCRNGLFPREEVDFSLADIKAKRGERVYFYSDDDDCPAKKNCRKRAYLVDGNTVIVSKKFRDFTCVWYQPKRGSETVGWIKTEKIEGLNFLTEKYKPWLGNWNFYESSLDITQGKGEGEFIVKGTAFWRGYGDNIHIGEIDSQSKLAPGDEGNVLNVSDGECKIKLTLVVSYLIVSDNLNCGGANVTFSGVYRKK